MVAISLRAEDDQDIEGAYTSVYPYATYTPENQGNGDGGSTSQQITVELPEKYVDGPYIGLYNERRVLIVDFSSNFKDKEVPTDWQVTQTLPKNTQLITV